MYVFLRHGVGDKKDELCFVQAKRVEDAKEMVGVAENYREWGVINTELIGGFCEVKEGYFVVSF